MADLKFSKGLGSHEAVDFDEIWGVLASSLREIHTKNASNLSFEQQYRFAYKLVLKKRGDDLYEKVKDLEADWLVTQTRPRILAEVTPTLLFRHGKATAMPITNEIRVVGEKFLRVLKETWEDHNLCMNMTTDVLMYMVGCITLWVISEAASNRSLLTEETQRIAYIARITGSRPYLLQQWGSSVILSSEHRFRPTTALLL